jgi:hypothetical protein
VQREREEHERRRQAELAERARLEAVRRDEEAKMRTEAEREQARIRAA